MLSLYMDDNHMEDQRQIILQMREYKKDMLGDRPWWSLCLELRKTRMETIPVAALNLAFLHGRTELYSGEAEVWNVQGQRWHIGDQHCSLHPALVSSLLHSLLCSHFNWYLRVVRGAHCPAGSTASAGMSNSFNLIRNTLLSPLIKVIVCVFNNKSQM